MNCAEVQRNLSLYLYGELEYAVEEQLEVHLEGCDFCQLALRREKGWHAAMQSEDRDVSFPLLAECRQTLNTGLAKTASRIVDRKPSFWQRWGDWMPVPVQGFSAKLAGVSFLVICAFSVGRWTSAHNLSLFSTSGDFAQMGIVGLHDQVRDVRAEPNGQVRIILDQIRQRELVGQLGDSRMLQLVLAAAQSPTNPALRVDSVSVLTGQNSPDVRNALLQSARHDSNAAVRLKAVEGLRAFAGEPVTRETLKFVLLHDDNAGVRAETINVLAPATEQIEISPELLDTVQQVMQDEPGDSYVHMRCLQILRATNASPGIY
jgi:hypothetical protein